VKNDDFGTHKYRDIQQEKIRKQSLVKGINQLYTGEDTEFNHTEFNYNEKMNEMITGAGVSQKTIDGQISDELCNENLMRLTSFPHYI
jgi:hypothetical protein